MAGFAIPTTLALVDKGKGVNIDLSWGQYALVLSNPGLAVPAILAGLRSR